MADQETCKNTYPCNGKDCFFRGDVEDQTDQIVNQGNPHGLTRPAAANWHKRKRGLLKFCLQPQLYEAALKRSEEQIEDHFSQQK